MRMMHPKIIFQTSLVFLLSAGLAGPMASWAEPPAARPEAPERAFEFTYRVEVPTLPASSHQLRLWIPLPGADGHQKVSQLRIEAPEGWKTVSRGEFGNHLAYIQVDPARVKTPFEILVRFHLVRHEYRVELPGNPPSGTASRNGPAVEPRAELARFLEPDRLVPINGVIGELSQEQTQGVTDPLAKARKVYEYVVAHMRYDKSGTGWGHGDAVWACNSHYGNCTDFHSLFIGMARAASIPARFEIGFPLPENQHEGEIPGYHCWAEFYVQGIGWVPVDASEAWKHPDRHDYYFGALDPNRVMFTRGRDLRLDPPQKGDRLNYFVYPYAEVDGKPFDAIKSKFSFRDLAPAATAAAAGQK
jgi:transglutaminase-like putative cysteine protease